LKHTQDLNEKIEFIIYISCIFLLFAICTLIYTDGILRDEYNLSIDRLGLSQSLLIVLIFTVIFIISKRFCRNTIIKKALIAVFIPIFILLSIKIGNNIFLARTIIQENKFRQTGFNRIHLKDLENILVKEKNATVYIDEENCPTCERIFPKLELYLYKNHIHMLSYNATEDRDYNLEELTAILDQLGVHRVPAILEIKDGIVSEAYFVEDIEKSYMNPTQNDQNDN
jgi:thiol-disulfide isomerase/thioredoxin